MPGPEIGLRGIVHRYKAVNNYFFTFYEMPYAFDNYVKGTLQTTEHNMANKCLKKLLHMGAIAAVTYYDELKCYYKRKVEQGKPKIPVSNNVRNKMVLRLAAVIKNNKPYQKIAACSFYFKP